MKNTKFQPDYTKRHSWCYGEILPDKGDGIEVPAQKWVDLTDGKVGVALMNNSKYGHSDSHEIGKDFL
ncbi:MAG: glycoside hydrolase family 38 C-terminal domain-containing protein [Mangrovibacterium sp.]